MRSFILAALVVFGGCNKTQPAECVYNPDCGEQAVCEEGVCRTVECLTTQECSFGSYCSETFSCAPGCGGDLDCPAGAQCEDNTCVEYGCRSTELDCALGQFCDDGTCKDDDRGHCEQCDPQGANTCGNTGTCVIYGGAESCNNNNDCGAGERCDNLGYGKVCHLDVCILECNPNAELNCPRGLSCVQALQGSNQYYCAGDCSYLVEEGAF
jgi:hypothetical protein